MTPEERTIFISLVKESLNGKSYTERIRLYSAKKRDLESHGIPVIGDLHQELISLYRV